MSTGTGGGTTRFAIELSLHNKQTRRSWLALVPGMLTVPEQDDHLNVTPGRCYVNLAVFKGGVLSDRVDAAATFDVEAANFYPTGAMHSREWTMGVIQQQWSGFSQE